MTTAFGAPTRRGWLFSAVVTVTRPEPMTPMLTAAYAVVQSPG